MGIPVWVRNRCTSLQTDSENRQVLMVTPSCNNLTKRGDYVNAKIGYLYLIYEHTKSNWFPADSLAENIKFAFSKIFPSHRDT